VERTLKVTDRLAKKMDRTTILKDSSIAAAKTLRQQVQQSAL